ncbi:neprilysin-like isoform X3 [Ornithodoros turicata]|uniref:neprilysin-like isoform X3 n=1 Tax=Ornithodoros turicata TaxID=34597 RepID=UPI00313934DE
MTDAGQTTESAATSVPQNEANLPSPSVVQRRCLRPQYCVYTAAVTVVLTLCSLGIYLASRSKLSSAMCRTRPCSHFSKILNKTINYSMNPCTDFYKYVCAGWKTSPIAPARSVFENYENSIAKIILERVLRERVPLKRQTAFQKAARLIQTCVDVKRNAHLSAETLRQLMASVGFQWPLPSETDAIELFVEVSLNWGLQIWGSLTVDRIVRDDNGRPLVTFSNSLHYFNWLRRKQEMKNTGTYFAGRYRISLLLLRTYFRDQLRWTRLQYCEGARGCIVVQSGKKLAKWNTVEDVHKPSEMSWNRHCIVPREVTWEHSCELLGPRSGILVASFAL